jgi:exopolysaccharide biosynthesis polyprenyl glycosylphosphotransferase
MADATRDQGLTTSPSSSAIARALTGTRGESPTTAWRITDGVLGVVLLLLVLVAGNLARMPSGVEEFLAVRLSLKNILLLTAFGLAWPAVLWACGLYEPARLREGQGEWPRLLLASGIACLLAMVFPLTSHSGTAEPIHALLFAAIIAPTAAVVRSGVRAVRQVRDRSRVHRVFLVGSGPLAALVHGGLNADPRVRREVVGFVDSDPQPSLAAAGVRHLGAVSEIEQLLMHEVVDEVFIALPVKSRYEEIQQALVACERVGIPATFPAPLFATTFGRPGSEHRENAPVMALGVARHDYRLGVKRAMDVLGAALILLLLSPVLLLVALAVKLSSPGPVLFAQDRYGYMKRRFRMLKFRTMVANAEKQQAALETQNEAAGPVFKIRSDPRITRLGRFLRRSSLDELPQLWHVLTGEMSLVGPRPLPVRDVGRFAEPWLMRRFGMRPGLTCLWQISGRCSLSFDQWIALDLQYIDRWSLWHDLSILARTLPAVVGGRGAI